MSHPNQQKRVFELSDQQYQKYVKWRHELEEKIALKQLETGRGFGGKQLRELVLKVIKKSLERGEPSPYYGAEGGAYVFSFTVTGRGIKITVKNTATSDEIDLTEEASPLSLATEPPESNHCSQVAYELAIPS